MNQMSQVAVDPVGAFVATASARMLALGYDVGFVKFECITWKREAPVWRFRPTTWNNSTLKDIEAPTQAECLRLAQAWLDDLRSEADTLNEYLGIAAE